jgi:citrate synthase
MADYDYFESKRNIIRSRKGGWEIGKGVVSHGYSMLDELMGHRSFFQVLIMHVTGRLPEKRLADWMEAVFISLSWPDVRMPPNFVGAIAAGAKVSPIAAVCLGSMASDSAIYGPGTFPATLSFLHKAMDHVTAGDSVKSFVDGLPPGNDGFPVRAPGYVRPFAYGDERVEAMLRVASSLGFGEHGPYMKLAMAIEDELYAKYGESLNLAGYMMAFLLDQGFTDDQCCSVFSLCVTGGVHACYVEYLDQVPESLLPLRCDDIEYTGEPSRAVPDRP